MIVFGFLDCHELISLTAKRRTARTSIQCGKRETLTKNRTGKANLYGSGGECSDTRNFRWVARAEMTTLSDDILVIIADLIFAVAPNLHPYPVYLVGGISTR
jgi:hypothetical protein